MSFTLAALTIVALAAVGLGLVSYHLLHRLDQLEQSVLGGLAPPTRRLSREEFEQRFETATVRSALAAQIDTGIVLILGAEVSASPITCALNTLTRGDLITVVLTASPGPDSPIVDVPGLIVTHDADAATRLRIPTTPFVFVIDAKRVAVAQPLASADDLLSVLKAHT